MNNFFWYLSWVPLTIFLYILQSFLTVKNNLYGKEWFWFFLIVSLFSPWPIISRFSKPENIFFEAMIFDSILILSYSIGLLYFTNSISKFGYNQWIGIILIFIGMIVFKKGI